ncbi:GNAT family N-acetyltransferase [Hyphobacterium sp. SN044]|uniref:GNAT family N-acetyltransferase n=1 Tax=Hyphobacterium sp. SN044 TaxID=2912575 RepID=UPI001F1FC928|nr:GNAT family N-acetyltransferase [Hyphobacterium sp. SN044]
MRSSPDLTLRSPRPGEAAALSALCLRSKAHWGYDAVFLETVAPYLQVDPDLIAGDFVRVAEDASGRALGVVQVDPKGKAGTLDLLFIEPFAIGTGAGRALYDWAKARLKAAGETRITILSDPDARGFYERMGAVFITDRPSDVFKGRLLPWLEAVL